MMGVDPIYLVITGIAMLASQFVGNMLRKKFNEYSELSLESNMSGKEIAEKMLQDNGILDVSVISVQGQLTDHYNPQNRTVNLSEVVYNARNISAAAVAAHECGHAIQHASAYPMLTMRSQLVPLVSISSKWMQYVLMAGIGLAATGSVFLLKVGVAMFAVTTLFSFVTLPVEFDASNRALNWLEETGLATKQEYPKAKDALKWAAMTYVVAALASLGQLLYYISFLKRAQQR